MSTPVPPAGFAGSGPPDPLPQRLAATARVLVALRRDRRTPWLPARKIHEARDARLRALVRHAAQHVPHYRDVFAGGGIDPNDVASADDLAELPLLEKESLQREPARFRSLSRAGEQAFSFPTSGSSGTPLIVFHTRAALLRYLSVSERSRDVPRLLLGRGRHRTLTIAHPSSTGTRTRALYRRLTLLPGRPGRFRISPELPIDAIVAALADRRPDVLAGWGNAIESIFRLAAAGEFRMHLPKLVDYYADALSEDGRRLIEEDFGIPVISTYGSVETFAIGFFCERRTGFHLHEDACHVRIVREDGTDAPEGEPGEVVVSNLLNTGTVLLNYRLGDVAAFLPDACGCGRGFRLLSAVHGRVNEIVRLADGRRVHPFSIAGAVRQEGLLRFRLSQEERARFRLEVVTTDEDAYARVVDAALPKLRAVLGGADVEVERRPALVDTARQKFRRVVALEEDGATARRRV
jgi:phenylacetate-CoA ligase